MKVTHAGLSDVGRKREHNEDSYIIVEQDRLFVVADGMGGHAAGEVASRVAVNAMADFIASTRRDAEITWPYEYDTNLSVASNRLKTAIRIANQKIIDTIAERRELEGMGTTLVAVLLNEGVACVAHVGDSRSYLLRNGRLSQLTGDHSWVNEQIKLGFLTKEEADRHPFRNVVTRALGSKEDVQVDIIEKPLQADDEILLCSDGLNTMADDDEILKIMEEAKGDADLAVRTLIAAANEEGGEDNVTAIVIHVHEP
jgi:serine/threonine protein phosphatase PrpC